MRLKCLLRFDLKSLLRHDIHHILALDIQVLCQLIRFDLRCYCHILFPYLSGLLRFFGRRFG